MSGDVGMLRHVINIAFSRVLQCTAVSVFVYLFFIWFCLFLEFFVFMLPLLYVKCYVLKNRIFGVLLDCCIFVVVAKYNHTCNNF